MINVKVSFPALGWSLNRQTPNESGIWNDYKFHVNPDIDVVEYEYWIIIEDLNNKETSICNRKNVILLTLEPETVKKYHPKYTNQFGKIITNRSDINHPDIIISQTFLPWMIGAKFDFRNVKWHDFYSKGYDELKELKPPEKPKKLSAILSNKALTKGHKDRINFVLKLKEVLQDDLDIFGVGFNPIEDKWDALAPYKYCLAFENCKQKNYWSEKLADSMLAFTFPIYYGCDNLKDYFDQNSYHEINFNNIEISISEIKKLINSDLYLNNRPYLEKARNQILDKYQFFPGIINLLEKNCDLQNNGAQSSVTISSQRNTKPFINKVIQSILR